MGGLPYSCKEVRGRHHIEHSKPQRLLGGRRHVIDEGPGERDDGRLPGAHGHAAGHEHPERGHKGARQRAQHPHPEAVPCICMYVTLGLHSTSCLQSQPTSCATLTSTGAMHPPGSKPFPCVQMRCLACFAAMFSSKPIMRKALKWAVSSEKTTDATSRPTRKADGSAPSATLLSWKAACHAICMRTTLSNTVNQTPACAIAASRSCLEASWLQMCLDRGGTVSTWICWLTPLLEMRPWSR